MYPMESTRHTHPGLVSIHHFGLQDCITDCIDRGLDKFTGLLEGRDHRRLGYGQAEQIVDQFRLALDRQHLIGAQMDCDRLDLRPVLHRCRHTFGEFAPVNLATTATFCGMYLMCYRRRKPAYIWR